MNRILEIFMAVVFFSSSGSAIDTAGHGGDPLAVEFVARGRYVLMKLRLLGPRIQSPITKGDVDLCEKELQITRVELVTTDLVDTNHGGIVTAMVLDDPTLPGHRYIKLNRHLWGEALRRNTNVNRLVFHEYLRVIGLGERDNTYQISSQLDDNGSLLPSRYDTIRLSDDIRGDMIPRTRFIEDEDVLASNAASKSYYASYLEWMQGLEKRIRMRLGPNVTLLNIDVAGFSAVKNSATDGYAGPDSGMTVGQYYRARPITRVYLQTSDAALKVMEMPNHPKIEGTVHLFQAFPKMAPASILAVLNNASTTYDSACRQWIASAKAMYADQFVFADCGQANELRDSDVSLAYGRAVKMSSYGTIYVLGAN